MEKSFDVKPEGIKYFCDSCESGEMFPTGRMKMFNTHALYPHICNSCGAEKDLSEKYPVIRYKFVTQ